MQGPSAHIDFETRSATDLRKSGVHRYCEDPTTYPWGFRYRIGNRGVIGEWRPGWSDPVDLLEHIAAGRTVTCHNAAFERTVWNTVVRRMCPRWPVMYVEQQDCTMSRAAAVALPQSLDKLGEAVGTNLRKDMDGHNLMMKMAKPRRFNEDGSITWWDDPEFVDRNMQYCGRDVEVETQADELLPELSPAWRQVWVFDQVINDRGIMFDMPVVDRAADLVDYAKKQNDKVMRDITDRQVPKCSNDAKIIAWLNTRGVPCTSLAKGEVDDVVFMAQVASDTAALDAIKLRKAAWKTSTAKYKAMRECVSSDGRIRGLLNFHGASTGRWAGRLVQPQNFPRVDPDDKLLQVKLDWLRELLSDGRLTVREVYEFVASVHGPLDVLDLLSKALRSMIMAAPGKKLVSGDFSNIEGRVNAWIAGEAWKLQAFRDYDAGTGPDLYKLAYARSFGVPVEDVGKGPKRQIGKVQELGLGYQGSIGAYITMGATYGVDPFSLSKPVEDATPAEQWDRTARMYHAPGTKRYSLFEREWTALKVLVDNWRAANPAIVQSWWNYQDAAIEAVAAPGNVVHPQHTQKVAYYSDQRSLWCVLPSGRMIHYSSPELVQEYREYYDAESGETRTRLQRKVKFMGVDSKTKQWREQSLYGGLQCENIVQAIAVDLLVDAMFRLEHAGYPVILTVHDEIVSEVDETRHDLDDKRFADIMSVTGPEYEGLPVSVGAWQDKRYVK